MTLDPSVLVVDADAAASASLLSLLASEGALGIACSTGSDALSALNAQPVQVVIAELALPDMSGADLIAAIEVRWPGTPVVVVAEGASVQDAMSAFRAGAADFLEKPIQSEQLAYVLGKVLAASRSFAGRPPSPPAGVRGILGTSPAMRHAHETLERAAQSTATVLVRGESGTGKELTARAIHDASPRAHQPFVKIDCAALPENLLESELFGYEKGAFTGATARKPGRVELADKGSLFLDEIAELSLPLQAKLLRLLQDRQFDRLGGTKTIGVDVRVIAATHRDLDAMVESGQFRTDLFYRLNVVPLWVPPLRARREDIELLASHFCSTFAAANGKRDLQIDAAAMRVLRAQRWPGNVRQLQNFVERLVVLSSGSVITESLVRSELAHQVSFKTQPGTAPGLPHERSASRSAAEAESLIVPLDAAVRAAERKALERALQHCRGNRSLAARMLGVSRTTLYAKLQEYGLL